MSIETSYRVYYLDAPLVKSFRQSRDKQQLVTRDYVGRAIDEHLSSIVRELKAIGFASQKERSAIRLEVPLSTLQDLADASAATTIPATTLLAICMARAVKVKPKRRKAS